MSTGSKYNIYETLCEQKSRRVYRGVRKEDMLPVIIKTGSAAAEAVNKLERESEILRELNFTGVSENIALESVEHRPALILKDFGGVSLDRLGLAGRLDLEKYLLLALEIAKTLVELHSRKYLHGRLEPAHILLNPESHDVKFAGISHAIKFSEKKEENIFNGSDSISLGYIAPEQTGRMNVPLDFRADLYSLGVCLYELLLGRLPFPGEDPEELVYFHIAGSPEEPSRLKDNIPKVLSRIIMRLLQKSPGERYQSAYGLKWDLEKCLRSLKSTGQIVEFTPGSRDISQLLRAPDRIYGREKEINILKSEYANIANKGLSTIFLNGNPGVGKTALIQVFLDYIGERGGYYIRGKFDQYRSNIPYYALIQGIQGFLEHILARGGVELQTWRETLNKSLGQNGRVIVDVLPELELIIGEQPPIPWLPPREEKNRFELTFRNFLRAFTSRQRPLVIVLDDLQWTDHSSLSWLRRFLSGSFLNYTLIIGVYRSNEVDPLHPLSRLNEEQGAEDLNIRQITLGPLAEEDLINYLRDTLDSEYSDVETAARICLSKTNGNPFFFKQFLDELYRDGLLTFDSSRGRWTWDLKAMENLGVTDNVVSIVVNRIRSLGSDILELLILASFMGTSFEPPALSRILKWSERKTRITMEDAEQEGLLVSRMGAQGRKFTFLHDRIQQAAYSMTPETKRPEVHLKIGRILLKYYDELHPEEGLLDIVDHLNEGLEYLDIGMEGRKAAELNYRAGMLARSSTSYEAFYKYLKTALAIIERIDNYFESELYLRILTRISEAAYLNEEFNDMERFTQRAFYVCKTDLQRLELYEIKISALELKGDYYECLRIGTKALAKYGAETFMPEKIRRIRTSFVYYKLYYLIRRFGLERIRNLAEMTDPIQLAICRILGRLSSIAYFFHPFLMINIQYELVRRTLKFGVNPAAAYGFVSFGGFQSRLSNRISFGYELSKAGVDLVERLPLSPHLPRALTLFNVICNYYRNPLRLTIREFHRARELAQETGDLEYLEYAWANSILISFEAGISLNLLHPECEQILSWTDKFPAYWVKPFYHIMTLLTRDDPPVFERSELSPPFDSRFERKEKYPAIARDAFVILLPEVETFFKERLTRNDSIGAYLVCHTTFTIAYLFGHYEVALEYVKKGRMLEKHVMGYHAAVILNFYESLISLSLADSRYGIKRLRLLLNVKQNQKKLKSLFECFPDNILNKYLLVEAEYARVKGDNKRALGLYERAALKSRENKFLHEEALTFELASRFAWRVGLEKLAGDYVLKAYNSYREWGARAKMKDLERSSGDILERTADLVLTGANRAGDDSLSFGRKLDLNNVLGLTQKISSEIILDNLIAEITRIIMMFTGAHRAVLLLSEGDELNVEAEGQKAGENPYIRRVEKNILDSPYEAALYPDALVAYAVKKEKILALENPAGDKRFLTDSYILENRPRFILCIPLINQSRLRGMFYLENVFGEFSDISEHFEVLNLLSSQMAISIDNARLYENRRRVKELTELDRVKSAFFTNISHDFRTPLTLILAPLENLLEKLEADRGTESGEARIELINMMRKNALSLLRLIENLLDVSKLDAGRLKPEKKIIEPGGFLGGIFEIFEPLAKARGLESGIKITDTPRYIFGDEELLERALLNLLGNAFKFTSVGGVYLSLEYVENFARIIISDTGRGISQENLNTIFERFWTLESDTLVNSGGSGLGLYLARRLIELHGGEISVESEIEVGSSFIVSIPLSLETAEILPDPQIDLAAREQNGRRGLRANRFLREGLVGELYEPDEKELSSHIPKMSPLSENDSHDIKERLLIVEDVRELREYLGKILSPYFEIELSENGKKGLERARLLQPEIILTDVAMPVMDGFQMLKELREDDLLRETPVIMLTARGDTSRRVEGLGLGADDYIAKPFETRELILRLKNLSRRHKKNEQAIAREKKRIFHDLHVHLGERLKDLTLIGEKLENSGFDNELVRRLREGIKRASATLHNELEHGDDLETLSRDLIKGLRLMLERRYSQIEREFEFKVFEKLPGVSGIEKESFRNIFYTALQEILTNDLKYGLGVSRWHIKPAPGKRSGGEKVEIILNASSTYDYEARSQGMGVSNIRNRVREVGGEFWYSLRDGKYEGVLSFPAKNFSS